MSIEAFALLRHPSRVPWWRWVEIGGACGLIALMVLFAIGRSPHPLAIAALLHIAADFTFQSSETALLKAKRDHHLLVHALAAGGLPLAVAGLVAGSPISVIVWAALGAASHYAVDWTRKFGARRLALGIVLDQSCHVATILILALTSCLF
jgi:uncharacterized protein DUF3307